MPTRAELQQILMKATVERAATEHYAQVLRAHLAAWRKQEAERHPVFAALLHGHNEAWAARIESLAASIEQHATTLRTQETQATQALVESPPPEPEPARTPRARKRK